MYYCRLARPELNLAKLSTLYNNFGSEDYLNATKLDEEIPLTTPIIVNDEDIFAYYKTTEAFYYNQYHGEEYEGYMLLYMAVVILIASIFNFTKKFTSGIIKSCQTNSLVMIVRKSLQILLAVVTNPVLHLNGVLTNFSTLPFQLEFKHGSALDTLSCLSFSIVSILMVIPKEIYGMILED